MKRDLILGIDGGGSKILVALADRSGRLLRLSRGGGVNPMDNPGWRQELDAQLAPFVGITTTGAKNPLSQKFMAFMTGPKFQDVVPETNWMFPAGKMDKPLNPAFDKLVKPAKTLIFSPEEVAKNRKAWVDEWLSVMSK